MTTEQMQEDYVVPTGSAMPASPSGSSNNWWHHKIFYLNLIFGSVYLHITILVKTAQQCQTFNQKNQQAFL